MSTTLSEDEKDKGAQIKGMLDHFHVMDDRWIVDSDGIGYMSATELITGFPHLDLDEVRRQIAQLPERWRAPAGVSHSQDELLSSDFGIGEVLKSFGIDLDVASKLVHPSVKRRLDVLVMIEGAEDWVKTEKNPAYLAHAVESLAFWKQELADEQANLNQAAIDLAANPSTETNPNQIAADTILQHLADPGVVEAAEHAAREQALAAEAARE